MSADLLVVGGGPVGLVTAMLARRRGLTVQVLEPRTGAIDKACGEGIMPAGLALLADLGVDPPGQAIRGVRYLADGRSVEAAFSRGAGRGVRRARLQPMLLAAARSAGVEVVRTAVVGIGQSSDEVDVLLRDGSRRRARYVVGADGLHSTVGRLCGLSAPVRRPLRRAGLRQHFAVEPWTDLVEVHWASDTEAYVTPVGEAEIGVALLTERPGPFAERLRAFPALLERLAGVGATSRVCGAGPFRRRTTARTAGRVALVGDAAGYVDAITGEGLTVGWRQAGALVEAIASGSLSGYEQAWRRVVRPSTLLTSGLLTAARHPTTRQMIVPTAARLPRVFGAIVDLAARG